MPHKGNKFCVCNVSYPIVDVMKIIQISGVKVSLGYTLFFTNIQRSQPLLDFDPYGNHYFHISYTYEHFMERTVHFCLHHHLKPLLVYYMTKAFPNVLISYCCMLCILNIWSSFISSLTSTISRFILWLSICCQFCV